MTVAEQTEVRTTGEVTLTRAQVDAVLRAAFPMNTVNPLKWLDLETDRGDGTSDVIGWECNSAVGLYSIEASGAEFFLTLSTILEAQELGRSDDPDILKGIAQANFCGHILSALAPISTELQHRREAEAVAWTFCPECGCEDSQDAEGIGSLRFCANCGQDWHTDVSYLEVVAKNLRRLAASPSSPASGVRVKALEWVQNWPSDPLTGFAKADHINRTYTVDHDAPRFYASTNVSPSDYSGDAIGNYGTFDEAKAACQADYEARIRSALGEHP